MFQKKKKHSEQSEGDKKLKDENYSQWEYWRDNRGLTMRKKHKQKPGMSLGDGHGRSGQEWDLKGCGYRNPPSRALTP